jgi:hypothetical protein
MDSLFGIVLLWAAANGSADATDAVREVYPVEEPVQHVDSSPKAGESRTKKVALKPNEDSGS